MIMDGTKTWLTISKSSGRQAESLCIYLCARGNTANSLEHTNVNQSQISCQKYHVAKMFFQGLHAQSGKLLCCRVHDHNDWLSMVVPGLRAPTALSPVSDAADSIGSFLNTGK